ncbi:hypothetical protein Dsin_011717 [Dipteronia sinensis]|uniref:BHLH domain-containing protein n=1 Tax=Dipteronia sinensis TaxID=43782 RepID=A0AAE0E7T3_9ROSI|nr:hypothetical protein Dsin_011717 [Dipteronia sinensis]
MALSTFSSNCWDYSFQLLQPDTTSFFNFQQTLQHDQFGFNIINNNSFDFPDTSYNIDPTLFQYSDDDELFYTDHTSSYINHLLPAYFSSPSHNMISLSPEIFPPLEDFESTHYPKRQRNHYDSSFRPNMFFGHVPEFLHEIPAPPLPEILVPGSFSCGTEKEKKANGVSLSVQSIAARERRRKITEKTQELTKLIPGGQRMNTAEMLQAASKYVKFLQAQAHLLQFMALIQVAGSEVPDWQAKMAMNTTHIVMLMMVALLFYVSGITAQDVAPPTTSPTMDTGAGFTSPGSWGVVVSSVFGSLIALLLH